MNDTEKLREIATSILEKSHDDAVARNAGELLKLAAEIENHRADARKLAIEEQKISSEVNESQDRLKSESRKAYIALLAPVFTTLILAGTLAMQSYQFQQSEKDKQEEAKRQAEAAEDVRWTEAVKLLSQSEKISPAGVLLKSFANSARYGSQAYKTAVEILLKTDDPQAFANLFGSVFDPVDWGNLPQVVELNRTIESQRTSLYFKSWDQGKQTSDQSRLTDKERKEHEDLETKLKFITSAIAPALKGPRPKGSTLDLRSADLWVGDFRGADLSGANLSDVDFTYINLEGANLSGITEYQSSRFVGSAWWRGSKISQGLLEHLVKNYPLDTGAQNYNSETPDSKLITRLQSLSSGNQLRRRDSRIKLSATRPPKTATDLVALWFVQDTQNLVRFRLHFLAIDADRPNQLCIVTMEVSLYAIHERHAATPPIPYTPSHVLRKFAFAVDNC